PQLEDERLLPAELALFGDRWSAVGGRHECGVAPPSPAAFHQDDRLALGDEVGDERALLVVDGRPGGDGKHQVLSGSAVLEVTAAVGAVTGAVVRVALVREEGGHPLVDADDDVASPAAVAAGGTTLG